MRKPKLILMNHYASIPRFPGPTRNFDFASVLVKQGWQVSLFSCKFNHYLRRYLPQTVLHENGVRLKWIWSTPYRGNSIQRELNIVIFSFLSFWVGLWTPAEIILTVTPPLESAFASWLLAKLKRVPFVLDVEDLWPDSIINMGFRNKFVIGWLRFLERFLYRHADHFLVVAGEMKEYLIRNGVPEAKIDLIPLGANLMENLADNRLHAHNRKIIRNKYGWADDEVIAVYVGAHGPANALDTLIQAAQILSGKEKIRIVMFGDGSDKPRLIKILNSLKLEIIQMEEPVPPEQVPEVLQASDIGIASLKDTPTFKTVRPNKLYEYMAAGLPIICCIDGEARKFVSETETGLCVPPEDAVGLAEALRRLSVDPELRRQFAEKGRKHIKNTGDRAKLALRMDEVLGKIIKGRRNL